MGAEDAADSAPENVPGVGTAQNPAALLSEPDKSSRSARIWAGVAALAALITLIGGVLDVPGKAKGMWETFFPPSAAAATPTHAATATGSAVPSPAATAAVWHAGWGPERDTFTGAHPASYAVLNSITDNPAVGDERNFVRVRMAGKGDYTDYLRVVPGDKIELSVYVGNDAADDLDGTAATIHGLQADFYFPPSGTDTGLSVTLSGKNAAEVWDGATVLSDVPVNLRPIAGSMRMLTNAGEWTIDMGNRLQVVKLGWEKSDGEFPVGYSADGKYRGNGYLTVEMDVVAAR